MLFPQSVVRSSRQQEGDAPRAPRTAARIWPHSWGRGGLARSRTGLEGFAVLCVAVPPRGPCRGEPTPIQSKGRDRKVRFAVGQVQTRLPLRRRRMTGTGDWRFANQVCACYIHSIFPSDP
jgi:hypothetical protein